jgi:glutamine amidotransferase
MNTVLADLGIGNLHSLAKALESQGARVTTTPEPERWLDADVLVLPGVGSFGAGLRGVAPVRDDLRELLEGGTPCLGVCLGMQLLFESSEEDAGEGIGFFKGRVRRFPRTVGKVPLMGWTTLRRTQDDDRLLQGIPADAYLYFVHSYYAEAARQDVVATARHGIDFAAVARRGRTVATQFHPEKSGAVGLRLIRNFLEEAEAVA